MAKPAPTTKAYDLLEMLFRHKGMALLIPTTVLLAGLAVALIAPRTFRSEARLALQIGRQSVAMDPTAQTGQQIVNVQQLGRDAEVVTALELLRSRGVIGKVVDRLGPDFVLRGGPESPGGGGGAIAGMVDATVGAAARGAIAALKSIDPISRREEAVIRVEKNLIADAERDSTLISVSYSTDTPAGAQTVLTTLIDVYREEHLRINRNQGSRTFFREQEDLIRGQLDEAMDRVRKAKDEIGVASIDSRRQNLESQLQSVTMSAFDAEAERNAITAELEDIARQLGTLPERLIASKKSIPNEGADLMREQLYSLQVREADLKARYSDTHPLVVAISQQIKEAERVVDKQSDVREETTDDVNPVHRELTLRSKQGQSRLASLDARLRSLRSQDELIRRDIEKLNADAMKLSLLEREQGILERKYITYTDNLEQTRIDEQIELQKVSSVSVAQEPTLERKPVSPSKLLVALGSLVLAFAGTAASIVGVEQVSDKLRTDKSIEQAVGAPILASIPESPVHGRVLAP